MKVSNTYSFLSSHGILPDIDKIPLTINLIQEEFDELKAAKNNIDIMDAISDIMVCAFNTAYHSGISSEDLERYIKAVELSNNSKICYTKAEAETTVQLYAEGKHPAALGKVIEAKIVFTGKYYSVQSMAGKVLKSHTYKEAQEFYGQK